MRIEKAINMIMIRNAIVEFVKEYKRAPSINEITEKINNDNKRNLSKRTVIRYARTIKLDGLKTPLRCLTADVLYSIYENARKPSGASDRKLWLQLVHGWVEKKEIDLSDERQSNQLEMRIKELEEKQNLNDIISEINQSLQTAGISQIGD